MAVKKTDYQIKRGSESVEIVRPVKINDKSQNLVIELKLNHKKGLYTIVQKWNYDAITGDDTLDAQTIEVMGELMMEGRDYCLAWREKWEGQNQDILEEQRAKSAARAAKRNRGKKFDNSDSLAMEFPNQDDGDGGVDDEMEAGAA